MRSLVVANWKMNPSHPNKVQALLGFLKKDLDKVSKTEIVICPPFPFLTLFLGQKGNLKWGGQDCFWEKTGPFTGEVSAQMLKSLGCQYVILGHSDRKRLWLEDEAIVNKKVKAAFEARLSVLFCLGEAKRQKIKSKANKILFWQLEKSLEGIKLPKGPSLCLSIIYEPVWAISSQNGQRDSLENIIEKKLLIQRFLEKRFGPRIGPKIRILYGGSVNGQNASSLFEKTKVHGFLVGQASLNPRAFAKIIKATEKGTKG